MKLRIEFANGGNIIVDGPHMSWEKLKADVMERGWLALGEKSLVNLDNVAYIVIEEDSK